MVEQTLIGINGWIRNAGDITSKKKKKLPNILIQICDILLKFVIINVCPTGCGYCKNLQNCKPVGNLIPPQSLRHPDPRQLWKNQQKINYNNWMVIIWSVKLSRGAGWLCCIELRNGMFTWSRFVEISHTSWLSKTILFF